MDTSMIPLLEVSIYIMVGFMVLLALIFYYVTGKQGKSNNQNTYSNYNNNNYNKAPSDQKNDDDDPIKNL